MMAESTRCSKDNVVEDIAEKKRIHIALTGHRPNKLGGYDIATPAYKRLQLDMEYYIEYQLTTHDVVYCHSGLALGADTIWSKAILAMKERYPKRVFFHAEIPMMNQKDAWFKKSDIDFWHKQVELADTSTVYDEDFHNYDESMRKRMAGKVLNQRNIGMIDHADVLLAVYDGTTSGGTKNAITYAESKGKEIQYIDPKNYFNQ